MNDEESKKLLTLPNNPGFGLGSALPHLEFTSSQLTSMPGITTFIHGSMPDRAQSLARVMEKNAPP